MPAAGLPTLPQGMVAQIATLARSFMHDVQAMNGAELETYLEKLGAIEGDELTLAARDLVRRLLTSELQSRSSATAAAAAS